MERIFSHGKLFLYKNKKVKELYERYHLLKIKGQREACVRSLETKTNSIWSQNEIDEFVSAISNSYVRCWTENISSTIQTEPYSRDKKLMLSEYEASKATMHCDDLAGDIESELQTVLSSIFSKIRSVDKMTLTNDILGVTRCHLKRLCHAFFPHRSETSNLIVNEEELITSFQFRHHVQTNKHTKKIDRSPWQESMNEILTKIDYFENSARKLLTIYGSRKNCSALSTVIIKKFLTEIIAHQLILKLVDTMSDPKFIHSYIIKFFSGLSLPLDSKYLSMQESPFQSQMKNGKSAYPSKEKLVLPCETHDLDKTQLSNDNNEEVCNLECPDIIDLTGYKVVNDSQKNNMASEIVKNQTLERSNVSRGSGKISQALGK